MNRRRFAASLVLLSSLGFTADAHTNPCDTTNESPYPGSPRVVQTEVDGVKVNVLLPVDYHQTSLNYPVLYLYSGATESQDTWLNFGDGALANFTEQFHGEDGVIVAMPATDGTAFSFGFDWRNGRHLFETHFFNALIPFIDASFRTKSDAAYRAIAGFSAGGFDAMHYAARHPDQFAAAGSFSGAVDFPSYRGPIGSAAMFPVDRVFVACDGGNPADQGVLGDPVRETVWAHDANPTDLASNLVGLSIYVAVGDGTPCDAADVESMTTDPATLLEPWHTDQAHTFAAALERAGIPFTRDFYGCGIHDERYYLRDLYAFWPQMAGSFGAPPPALWNHRRAASEFANRGWTFRADAERAPEFLDVTRASASGVTLTGSGASVVTTAPFFVPGQPVQLDGAKESLAIADTTGAITFQVDLGPAHRFQQYGPEQRIEEALQGPAYWVTRSVTFSISASP